MSAVLLVQLPDLCVVQVIGLVPLRASEAFIDLMVKQYQVRDYCKAQHPIFISHCNTDFTNTNGIS